ncbi:MAG TPA: hypothetical protein VJ063_19195, partial [Verrucomicrobiae bacterium]|nr:hypothetical protein [Verrucomicrobiae bacterium]
IFLAQVADAALDPSLPPPPDAKAFLGALKRKAFDRPEFVVGNLTTLVSKPAEITPRWRAMSVLMLPACFVLLGIFGAGMFNFERIRWDRTWKSLYPDRPHFLDAAQSYIELAEENDQTNDIELARAYLVTHFADVITNETFWSNPDLVSTLGEHERKLVREAVARPAPARDVVQEAERVVPRWMAKKESQARRLPLGVSAGVFLFSVISVGLVELIAAIFRRSFVLNLFGIVVVGADGQLATRKRLLARWAVGTLPILAAFVAGMVALVKSGTLVFLQDATSILGIGTAALMIAAIAYAIRRPSHSLADRIARTYLVRK